MSLPKSETPGALLVLFCALLPIVAAVEIVGALVFGAWVVGK